MRDIQTERRGWERSKRKHWRIAAKLNSRDTGITTCILNCHWNDYFSLRSRHLYWKKCNNNKKPFQNETFNETVWRLIMNSPSARYPRSRAHLKLTCRLPSRHNLVLIISWMPRSSKSYSLGTIFCVKCQSIRFCFHPNLAICITVLRNAFKHL